MTTPASQRTRPPVPGRRARAIFQNHDDFVAKALEFLEAPQHEPLPSGEQM